MNMDWNDLSQFKCEKHGDIGGVTMNVTLSPRDGPAQSTMYCMLCFSEMIAAHCCVATPVAKTTT